MPTCDWLRKRAWFRGRNRQKSRLPDKEMEKTSRIFVAGHRGLAGSAIVRCLRAKGYTNLILRSRAEVDLTCCKSVNSLFESERPEYVFLAAAKVGGILANATYPADFIRENLAIQLNVLETAWL